MTVFLAGVGAQFYRGIGSEVQRAAPFADMNFFIGPNNSGKSIFLNLIAGYVSQASGKPALKILTAPDSFRGEKTGNLLICIGIEKGSALESFLKRNPRLEQELKNRDRNNPLLRAVNKIFDEISEEGLIWLTPSEGRWALLNKVEAQVASGWAVPWDQVWFKLTNQSGGSISAHWVPETLAILVAGVVPGIPSIHLIPAKRSLGQRGEAFDDLSGKGLIDHLAALQNPAWDRQTDRDVFEKINRFLREVTGKPDALLEVPSDREHLLVHMDDKVLPLESLGTGIYEVVLIAAFCTIHDRSIMCIEEPEIHLHPLLQRKLAKYLQDNTSSQYFIATHSAAFIDSGNSNVFHVFNDGDQTRIRPALTDQAKRTLLDDLGYQASDLLQSNAVIWVEGPSDRIYLNHWIRSFAPDLWEGIHYTIMFYGGSLIRHLSASDKIVSDFIGLRKLNRNMAIILDSDKESPDDKLKPHVQRILAEMKDSDGMVWVTSGREVENYVPGEILQDALREVHPRIFLANGKTGTYDHAFHFFRKDPNNPDRRVTFKEGDKVGAASIVCSKPADLGQLDLRERISELTSLIRKANGLPFDD